MASAQDDPLSLVRVDQVSCSDLFQYGLVGRCVFFCHLGFSITYDALGQRKIKQLGRVISRLLV